VPRRIRRHTGVRALVFLSVAAALALFLAYRYHLGVAATLVAILLGLPGFYLAWVAVSGSPGGAGSLSVAPVADQLATAVGEQWQAEAALRRLNDPYPLPVSWAAADPSLTDAWGSLVRLAVSGAGWPAPASAGTWAAGPDELAGEGGELVDVLARVPTGRLVVLGEPGAGKTMLMVRLVLDLLARRAAGGPVPVLVSVASWNPADRGQDLRAWLGAQLMIDHPALAAAPPGGDEPTQAAALLAAGLILPVLDGLDEIPEQVRGPAISRINDALRPGEHLVVTCRSQQYQDTVRPAGGAGVTLRGAAAVQLCPLGAGDVGGYLCDDAAGPAARARWGPVVKLLGTEVPAAQALTTPLMVGLARAIYDPRPGQAAAALRDPAELCSAAVADRAAVESLLFDAFIPAAYRDDPVGRWTAQDAERWLVFLARHLERTIGGPDLGWWQLPQAVPARGLWAMAGAVTGVLAGTVAGIGFAIAGGVVLGAVLGAVTWAATVYLTVTLVPIMATVRSPTPTPGIRSRSSRWGIVIPAAAVAGIAAGVAAGIAAGRGAGPVVGWVVAFLVGLGSWFVIQERAPPDIGSAASPLSLLARDRHAAMIVWALTGLAAAGAVALGSVTGSVVAAAVWAGAMVVGGTTLSFTSVTAWPSYAIARIWLALRHRLPWPLIGFLADAHRRGVLRQAGAVYQFRHIDLQHRLATRP
jgi:hypothetical protein